MVAATVRHNGVGERHYGPRVILPRRIKADLADGAIAATILICPLLVGQALTGIVPDSLLRVFGLGIPAGAGYSLFRDSAGRGTSLGKRVLGLRLIRLEDGKPCTARRVWARNLLDPIPIVDLIDFVFMCVDEHGQKLMDRRLQTHVVEKSDLDPTTVSVRSAPQVRPAEPTRQLPSKGRRGAVILGYWAVSFALFLLAIVMIVPESCLLSDRCSSRDEAVIGILAVVWLALLVGIVAVGWSGWLWGARRRRSMFSGEARTGEGSR